MSTKRMKVKLKLNNILKHHTMNPRGDQMKVVELLSPEINNEYLLMRAIKDRRTRRKINRNELTLQEISNILWVGCGQTKEATKRSKNRRTIASACNSQKVSIYIALDSGLYSYNEARHHLIEIHNKDIRKDLVNQKMLKSAPAVIVYVAKKEEKSGVIKHDDVMGSLLIGTEVGAMSQNIYLYCTEAKLNTVLVGLFNRELARELLCLEQKFEVIYTQVIG